MNNNNNKRPTRAYRRKRNNNPQRIRPKNVRPLRNRQRNAPKRIQTNTRFRQNRIPVAFGESVSSGSPMMNTLKDNIKVRHSEFIGNLTSDDGLFTMVISQYLNPGNPTLFPWMNSIAKNYESYVIEQLQLRYVPLCPTSTPGQVVITIDYDAADEAPTDLVAMCNMQNTITFSPYQKAIHVSTHEQLNKGVKARWVNPSNVAPVDGQDVKTLHAGVVYVVTSGVSGTLGGLWIDYDISLKTPTIKSGVDDVDQNFMGTATVTESVPIAHPFTGPPNNMNMTYTASPFVTAVSGGTNYDTIYFKNGGNYIMIFNGYGVNITGSPAFIVGDETNANFRSYSTAPVYFSEAFVLHENITPSSDNLGSFLVVILLRTVEGGRYDINLGNNSFCTGNLNETYVEFIPIEIDLAAALEKWYDDAYLWPLLGNPYTNPEFMSTKTANRAVMDLLTRPIQLNVTTDDINRDEEDDIIIARMLSSVKKTSNQPSLDRAKNS